MIKRNFYSAILIAALFVWADTANAQSAIVELSSNNNTSSFNILKNNGSNLLRLFGDGGFYLRGIIDDGAIPVTGAGTRLMWYGSKASFRSGLVTGSQWDDINTGYRSVAFGYNTIASGNNSLASGFSTTASGDQSTAFGYNSIASGDNSFSFNGTASGFGSIAFGLGSLASGDSSVAFGNSSTASGTSSITFGNSISSGLYSTALGFHNRAAGDYSTAIGKDAKANHNGSFVFGDASAVSSGDSVYSTAINQMTMRYISGYRIYTAQNLSSGVSVGAGGNSWSAISDSTKKENFANQDDDYFLSSLSNLRLGSWNYKSQDDTYRHYGPMAQEIFKYFGKDSFGTIGNDTTIVSADMDGIIMILTRALEKKSADLQAKQLQLLETAKRIADLEDIYSSREEKLLSQQSLINELGTQLILMKNKVSVLKEKKASYSVTKTENN